uniref:Transposable element n=1 Tax=Schistocephalus solidus TaxID=70667 RepID=A0A183TDP5_SCHSO
LVCHRLDTNSCGEIEPMPQESFAMSLVEYGRRTSITSDRNSKHLSSKITLNQAFAAKMPALINRRGVILRQGNARPHLTRQVQKNIGRLPTNLLSCV